MHGDDPGAHAPRRFVACASSRPDLTFFVTKMGGGIAGSAEGQVHARLAAAAPQGVSANMVKPAGWGAPGPCQTARQTSAGKAYAKQQADISSRLPPARRSLGTGMPGVLIDVGWVDSTPA